MLDIRECSPTGAKYVRADNSIIEFNYDDPTYGNVPHSVSFYETEEDRVALWVHLTAGTVSPYQEPTDNEKRVSMPTLSPRQLRLCLVRNGFTMATVSAAIDAIADQNLQEETRIEWEYATTFERTSGAVNALAQSLGLSPADVDTLWIAAAQI